MSSNLPGTIGVALVGFLVGALIPHIIGPIREGAKLVSGHEPNRERVCVPERYFREVKS
jgi:hypothetical protein